MKKILIISLAIFIIIPLNVSAITLGEYENKLQQYIDEARANSDSINKIQAEINNVNSEINSIKNEIKKLGEEVERLTREIAEYNEQIKEKSLQTKEIFEYLQMSTSENVYLEYVFNADTITDLIYRTAVVEQLTEYNEKVTRELENMIQKNKDREIEIKNINIQLEAKQKQYENKLKDLGIAKNKLQANTASINEQLKIYQQLVDSYKAQGCTSNDVIGIDCAVNNFVGTFRRPVQKGYITSEFGSRWGDFHQGLDISTSDPYNTKIYPVANGKITSIWTDIYGALVVNMEHYDVVNNKYYTSMYGHLSSYAPGIYVGKTMTTDMFIGYMGSSGYSTGPHLHVEIAECRIYIDYECRNWDAYSNFIRKSANNGFKGLRQFVNFPNPYVYWYTR